MSDSVATEAYPQGPNTLRIGAWDAAGELVGASRTIYVDNQQPTISLSGPTDAPSTAGTQYVTATASAGPSGVAGVWCSVDGGSGRWYSGASARVPVSGVGQHQVLCVAENNAVDGNGNHGVSATETFGMKIGVPTVTAIAFSKRAPRLHCSRVVRHVAAAEKRCKPFTGNTTSLVVRHSHTTEVSGWLGTYTGNALAGQTVAVLAAADNGRKTFKPVAAARTAANGSWRATVPAGPSRLIQAAYGGGPGVQASRSELMHEIVPAKIQLLSVSPQAIAWGQTVRIVGKLDGGYLPPGGALVRLRIGLGSAYTTFGVHEHVSGTGRFATTYTFGLGAPSIRRVYWFQVASLPMGDYPYAPASSRRISVTVGGR